MKCTQCGKKKKLKKYGKSRLCKDCYDAADSSTFGDLFGKAEEK